MEVYNMKLNNLSRLTALLMAIMMLAMASAVAEDSGIDLGDLTGDYVASLDAAVEMVEAGYCSICADELANKSITEWPVEGCQCLYLHLADMSVSQAYEYLYELATGTYDQQDLYWAYIQAHNTHNINNPTACPSIICWKDNCSKFVQYAPVAPGAANHDATCPWSKEEYTPSVTTSPDVSTPDELKNALAQGTTTIKLTLGVTGEGMTYVWQTSTNPEAENATWTDITGATSNTYDLPITPAAVGQAYRCVAKDADGNVVSTSAPVYLGGEVFFTWATTAADVAAWLALDGNKMEYVLAAYAASLKSIALAEVIHVTTLQTTAEDGSTVDALCLLELYGLTTLAEIDADGNVIDTRYHIAVATYDETTGTITALGN